MIFLIVSAVAGLVGGLFVSQFFNQYTLGPLGNAVSGITGGLAAHTLTVYIFGGSAFSVAAVGGFLAGVIVRGAFSIIRERMTR